MIAVRDRAGLTVLDARGVIVAITTDRDEAGTFIGDEAAWLASKGLRRVGGWTAHNWRLGSSWPYDVPATHSECSIERIPEEGSA